MRPRMNVFITTSKKSLYLAYPAIVSLFEHNQDSEVFLYIASEDLVQEDIAAESEQASRYGHHIIICTFDEEACRKQIVSSDPDHWPVGAMSCYWMFHELLPPEVDRILAIEADTVTIGSLREFYEIDLEANYVACPDPEHKPLNHKKDMDDLHGDVLTFVGSVYDVKKIRNDFTLQQILQMDGKISQKYGQSQMELTFGVLFREKIKYIPAPSYSIEENRQFVERFGYDYMEACEKTCAILHFSSTRDKEKPWNPTNIMPGYLYWWDYARRSPYYKRYFEEQWKIYARLKEENEALKKNISYRNILMAAIVMMIILEIAVMGVIVKEWYVVPLTVAVAVGAMAGAVAVRTMQKNRNIIYTLLSCVWRNTILKWYRGHKENKEEKYWQEHKKRLGRDNPDKIFYVIRRRDWYCGLFSLFLTNLQRIDDAVKAGYIPVVDLQNDFNIYLSEEKLGKENAWEYYFEQPMGYSLQDIQKSQNIIIGSGAVPDMFPYLNVDFLYGKTGELEYWRELVKKYMKLSKEAAEQVQREYDRLFQKEDKILGVKCRGTDYANDRPANHPIQPTPEQAVAKAEEIFQNQKCTKVFLATEDAAFYDIFLEKFGSRLITNKTQYAQYHGGSAGKEEYERDDGGYKAGMEYLVTTMLLARCACLCAGCVSGTVAALLLTEGYEYVYLFDLGIYQ